jgi:hypothetical protein
LFVTLPRVNPGYINLSSRFGTLYADRHAASPRVLLENH